MKLKIGDSVELVHPKFYPAAPGGVVVAVNYAVGTITFDEDFGGGRGTYDESYFNFSEPDETTLKWRERAACPPTTEMSGKWARMTVPDLIAGAMIADVYEQRLFDGIAKLGGVIRTEGSASRRDLLDIVAAFGFDPHAIAGSTGEETP